MEPMLTRPLWLKASASNLFPENRPGYLNLSWVLILFHDLAAYDGIALPSAARLGNLAPRLEFSSYHPKTPAWHEPELGQHNPSHPSEMKSRAFVGPPTE
jgi:hypothetical protein